MKSIKQRLDDLQGHGRSAPSSLPQGWVGRGRRWDVLIACEYSGTVRDAIRRNGHNAISCDLLPTDVPGPHIQGDVLAHLDDGWDALIAHPPCTHLSVSGAHAWKEKQRDGRQQEAIVFFAAFIGADIPMICIENPVGIMSTIWQEPDQIVQPYQFREDASKRTCLWLKNLPLLIPTGYVEPRWVNGKPRWANQTDSGQNRLPPTADRWKLRSTTYPGIAWAMADQWFPLEE